MSFLNRIEYYLPETVLTNQDLEQEFPECSSSKISDKIGINQRHIAKPDETALDLAYMAASKLLQNFDKSKIDFLLLCTQSPEYHLPTTACILQNKLGLNTSIGAIDYPLGCSGYVYGLAIATSLVQSNIAKNVLLVTAETYSKFLYPKDKANRSIFGDAATATIITENDIDQILKFDLGTDGSGMAHLIVPNGGMRNKIEIDPIEISDDNGTRTNNHLYMDGAAIFNFTIENIPNTINNCLNKNEMRMDDIDYFVFHQANKFMLNHLRKKFKIPAEKFYIDMANTGNTVSCTIPIALKDCFDKGLIKSGDKVLLCGFGVGLSWGTTIVKI